MQTQIAGQSRFSLCQLVRIKSQPYEQFIADIALSGDTVAIEVKIADLCDHLRMGCPKSLVPRYLNALKILHRPPANTEAVTP